MARVPPDRVPGWERDWPGLLDWELDRLEERGATDLQIVAAGLDRGVLVVRFQWPLGDELLALQATFPGGYPLVRPQVQLLNDRADWPARHVSPLDGNICLLGRDTAQWSPASDHLAELLVSQLEDALLGQGAEDPQAEPAEVWWNGQAAAPNSYCLVDSSWQLGAATHGRLELRYVLGAKDEASSNLDLHALPPFRGYVARVWDEAGTVIAAWTAPLPQELARTVQSMSIPWHRLDTTLLPGDPTKLSELRRLHFGGPGKAPSIAPDLCFRAFAFVHPMEISDDVTADGWIVAGEWGRPKEFKKPGGHTFRSGTLPILRAGATDQGQRVPAVHVLGGKRVAVFGVGSIGAPIALELARNGCAELRLLDPDIVEPGNSIRWPLGAAAWGRLKVDALAEHIAVHHPAVHVVPIAHLLGGVQRLTDDDALEQALHGTDLVVDATASAGAGQLLWDRCHRRGLPLIKVAATPSLGGGTVARYVVGSGCPVCLLWAREDEEVPLPPGMEDTDSLVQPPGCSERTFVGADYDLQELSLQAMRLVIDTLLVPTASGVVQVLSLVDEQGAHCLPSWQTHSLPPHPKCCGKVG